MLKTRDVLHCARRGSHGTGHGNVQGCGFLGAVLVLHPEQRESLALKSLERRCKLHVASHAGHGSLHCASEAMSFYRNLGFVPTAATVWQYPDDAPSAPS